MTDASDNIVKFEPRPPPERKFIYCEVRLDDPSGLSLTLVDEIGDREVFGYLLVAKPKDFDEARLPEIWSSNFRGSSGRAY